jgi:hypothetical protein
MTIFFLENWETQILKNGCAKHMICNNVEN